MSSGNLLNGKKKQKTNPTPFQWRNFIDMKLILKSKSRQNKIKHKTRSHRKKSLQDFSKNKAVDTSHGTVVASVLHVANKQITISENASCEEEQLLATRAGHRLRNNGNNCIHSRVARCSTNRRAVSAPTFAPALWWQDQHQRYWHWAAISRRLHFPYNSHPG